MSNTEKSQRRVPRQNLDELERRVRERTRELEQRNEELRREIAERQRAEAALRASEEQHRAELERQVRERTAELQQSRDLLQATMDSSLDMIQVFEAVRDERGEIVDFRWILNNHTSESQYGDVLGQSLRERNPGVVEEGIFDTFRRVTETGEPVVAERHYVHEQFNGWFYQSAVKLGDGVATTTKDITAWKQAQEEVLRLRDEVAQAQLRDSEQNLHGVANVVPDLLWYSEPDGLTPWYNNRWLEYTGQTLEQACGWGWVDAIHPEDREASARRYREAVEQSKLLQLEHRIRCHDGEYRWFLVRAEPLCDEQGRVTRMYGAATDIHDQRLALEALRRSEERLKRAVAIETVGVLFFRLDGQIHDANEAFLRMCGYSRDELRNLGDYARLTPTEHLAVTRRAAAELSEKGETAPYEKQMVRPDGSPWWGLFAPTRLSGSAADSECVEFIIDITERKRAEAALRESEERYRTLFNAIDQGFCIFELILDEAGQPVDFRYMETNEGFEKQTGRRPQPGQTMRELFPEAQDMWLNEYAEVARTGVAKRFIVHNEGVDRWFDLYVFPTAAPRERNQLAALFSDVTERHRDEIALRESEEQFRRAVQEAPIPIIMHAEDGQVLQISRTWTELTGFRPEDIPTFEAWLNHAYGEGADAVRGHMHQLFAGARRSINIEFPIRTHSGEQRYWTFSASSPGTLRDGRRFIVGMAVDITGRKRHEANQRLLIDISEDLSRLSDEEEIIRAVGTKLVTHLNLTCYHYVEVNEERAEVTIRYFWHALSVPPILGTYPIQGSASPEGLRSLRAGESLVVNDVATAYAGDDPVAMTMKAGAAAQKIAAFITVPYSQDGRWKAYFAAADSMPREWTSSEIELIQEVCNRTLPRLERARSERALRESEHRFRLLVSNVKEYALFQTDLEGRVTSWNPGAQRLFGYTSAEMLGQSASCLLTPEDQQAGVLQQELARARNGAPSQDARWVVCKEDRRFWAQWVTEPVRDETGTIRGVAKVLRDETDRKRAEERQQLLVGELNHRVKNTLATVQAMASQTLRSTADPEEFSTRFQQRLQALSRAHNLLTRSNWEGAEVGELVREQLELEGDGEPVTAAGPPTFLDAQSSLALALVLHELGTNARKYGALSVPEGRLSVRWQICTEDAGARLQLDWLERGGPPVFVPERRGFGTTLISMSLRSVDGKTALHFDPEGVRCRLEVPLGSGPGEGLSRKDIQLR